MPMSDIPPQFHEVTRALLDTLTEFRAVIAGPMAPDAQVREWQLWIGDVGGGVWCAQPECSCTAESSEIGDFQGYPDEGTQFTLTDLHEAIAQHIANRIDRDAEDAELDEAEADLS